MSQRSEGEIEVLLPFIQLHGSVIGRWRTAVTKPKANGLSRISLAVRVLVALLWISLLSTLLLRASVTSTGVSDRGTSWRQGTKLPKDSHQFIEEFLVVVADAEDVLLILFGQGALLRRAVSECVCRHGPSSVFHPWPMS
ncbi:MAG: hypothetical protein WBX00_28100 [Isosphaeraceae bacterium]